MKKLVFCAVLLFVCTLNLLAQSKTITVSGRVIEAETKEPVEMATVQLLSLPDSAQASGIVTQRNGYFSLPKVSAGKYVLRVAYLGFNTQNIPLTLNSNATEKNVGTISLGVDAVMLKEAVITAEAPQVTVVEDTLMYNTSAYRVPEGAMLEELVKKIPGAEIDEDGNVKINGKEVKKIMVEGKEFFGGDVKTGLKNLPVNMIDKLKTYDKKSDLARITGIDDGEEETVLDLKVKKGMNQGWFGNADIAYGTEKRYLGNLMLNRFVDGTQLSIIGGGNNVNDQGFSSGGGVPRWRRNNGLNATKTVGVNFASETSKLETGGSVRYNYKNSDIVNTGYSERFLQSGNSFSNSNSKNITKNLDLNADFRLEWKPDTMTNILFRPDVSYGKTKNESESFSGTFNSDPFAIVSNPNSYLDFNSLDSNEDPLRDIRVNAINSHSFRKSNSLNANATLQLNRKLNSLGRNVTFRGRFGYSDNNNDSYTDSETRYYQLLNAAGNDSILYRNQYITTPTSNYTYSAQVTYSEPIAKATFLQFSYNFTYKNSKSDKRTYSLGDDWDIYDPLPPGYQQNFVDSLSKDAEYHYYNHDITANIRIIRENYQLTAGGSFQPQKSTLSYKRGDYTIDTTRHVFNFTPTVDFRYRFSKVSQLRFTYRGRSNQPSMENLLPIVDNSDPLRISVGNPGLKPSFSHNIRLFFNTYNAEAQRGIMTHVRFTATQNAIANATEYNEQTGGTISQPQNINGNWNAAGMFGFNTALPNKKFTVNSFTQVRYTNSVAFLYEQEKQINEKNTSTELVLGERVNAAYRNNWLEIGINGSIDYSFEKNKLRPESNQQPFTFSYGANTNISLPWNMTIATNIANQARRGYLDNSMNRNELIWNAQIAQTFFKGSTTVSFEWYDILRQQTNISRSLTASMRSVSEYNGINSYCMFHVIYRLNVFGSKAAREGMNNRGGFGGPRGDRPPGHPSGGGFGGGRPSF